MDYKIKEETLTGIAEAIRSKTGKTEEIIAADFAGNINSIDTSKPEETKEVLLDFSGGDMEVTPEEGNVFSEVTIPQPENLLPENIAEGINIAGIVGTLAAGGGAVVNAGKFFTETSDPHVIEHGLGVKPDLFVYVHQLSVVGKHIKDCGWAMSMDLYNIINPKGGFFFKGRVALGTSDTSMGYSTQNIPLDGTGSGVQCLQCDDTTITMGNADYGLIQSTSYPYYWFAIGGLT